MGTLSVDPQTEPTETQQKVFTRELSPGHVYELKRAKEQRVSRKAAIGAILLVSTVAFGDASYQSTTQITGGALVDGLRNQPLFGKRLEKMFAPESTTTMVHGNQKAIVSKLSTEIIDLDKEVIITIDNEKKTYRVTTFAQMRQVAQQVPQKIEQAQAEAKQEQPQSAPQSNLKTSFDFSVKDTGASKMVNGLNAQEKILTLTMHISNPDAPAGQPNTVDFVVTSDVWVAPEPPELGEIHDFDVRFTKKMAEGVDVSAYMALFKGSSGNNPGMGQALAGKPGASEAMTQMAKEAAKLNGLHVLEVTSVGGSSNAPAGAAPAPVPTANTPPPQSSGSSATEQVATETAAAGVSSRSASGLSSAIGTSMIGAFRRKRTQQQQQQQQASQAAPNGEPPPSGVLLQTTTQKSNFSHDPIPVSMFQVPSGYRQLQSAAQ